MTVSLNQERGEVGIFLLNILVNFAKNVSVYIILIVNTIFYQFSSLWNFMTHLFYSRLLTSSSANFSGKFDLLVLCGDIASNPG